MSYCGRASYNRTPNCVSRNTKPYNVRGVFLSIFLLPFAAFPLPNSPCKS